jgi:cation diffusion facilitator CzcD-associated flavoprotein CzcO
MTDVDILIIGTGFAGIGMAIRLKQAGIDDFLLVERAGDVGGTWRDNHYPGAACDVQSHLYSFSFEPNPAWTRDFAPQREILDYLVRCTDKYGVRPHIRFHTEIVSASFDERGGRWQVRASGGRTFRARVVVSACGGLSRPSLPDIEGIESFAGTTFHSARWDHSVPIEGKRVAVIGTGASAVQIVPAIAPRVGRLFVYQRTPPWIVPKPDGPISPLAQRVFRRAPALQRVARQALYWQKEVFAVGFVVDPRVMKLLEPIARSFLRRSVRDPELRATLAPSYAMGCKRILPTNDYYPAIQRDNVEVVTAGIDAIVPSGIRTKDGLTRELDAIVLATGFQAAEQVAPFEVRGRGGHELNDVWRDGAEAYLGTTVAGFPNLFLIVGPNTGLGHSSMILMIESQVQYILSCVQTMRERGIETVEVREDAQRRYNAGIHARLAKTVWASGCTSWYKTRTGKNTTLWPGFTFEFRLRTRRFQPRDYELVARGAQPLPAAAE